MTFELYMLDRSLKIFLLLFVITLSTGVLAGLGFLYQTTHMTAGGTIVRFNGSQADSSDDEFDIRTEYPKPLGEMLLTTHTHVISFSLIFLLMGLVFYGSTVIRGGWKVFFMTEPLVSTLVTFGSIWAIRFINSAFVYLTVVSAVLLYTSYFIMAGAVMGEILFKKTGNYSGIQKPGVRSQESECRNR